MGNPSPVFGSRGVRLDGARRVGPGHLKGTLAGGGSRLAAIGFGWADRAPQVEVLDVAFRLEQNEWQGEVSLQARIVALTVAGQAWAGGAEEASGVGRQGPRIESPTPGA
jgi:single-stranded-DNA-specific exonuclease